MYDETRQQVHDIVEFTNTNEAITLNKTISFVTICGIVIGLLGLVAGILGMNILKENIPTEEQLDIIGIDLLNWVASYAIPFTLTLGLIFLLIFHLKFKK